MFSNKNYVVAPLFLIFLGVFTNVQASSDDFSVKCQNLMDVNNLGVWENPELLVTCGIAESAKGNVIAKKTTATAQIESAQAQQTVTKTAPNEVKEDVVDSPKLADKTAPPPIQAEPSAPPITNIVPEPVTPPPAPLPTVAPKPTPPISLTDSQQVIYSRYANHNNEQRVGRIHIESQNPAGPLIGSAKNPTATQIDIKFYDKDGNILKADNTRAELSQLYLGENPSGGSALASAGRRQLVPGSELRFDASIKNLPDYWDGIYSIRKIDDEEVEVTLPFFGTITTIVKNTTNISSDGRFVGGIKTPVDAINRLIGEGTNLEYKGKSAFNDQDFSMTFNVEQQKVDGNFTANKAAPAFSFEGELDGSHIISTKVTGVDSGFVQGTFIGDEAQRVAGAYKVTQSNNTVTDVFTGDRQK